MTQKNHLLKQKTKFLTGIGMQMTQWLLATTLILSLTELNIVKEIGIATTKYVIIGFGVLAIITFNIESLKLIMLGTTQKNTPFYHQQIKPPKKKKANEI